MKVLVTGRNGFLAKEISEHLSDLDLTFVGRQDLDLTDPSAVLMLYYTPQSRAVVGESLIVFKTSLIISQCLITCWPTEINLIS